MNFNRKSITGVLAGLGLVGALVTGGVVAAQAATGEGSTPQPVSTNSSIVGARHHMNGMAFGQNLPMTAVPSFLGLSQTELADQLQSGKSLADVAGTQGKSVSGLEDAMVAAFTTNLDTTRTLTPDQKVAAGEEMKSRIKTMVHAAHNSGEGMGMGAAFGAGMGMHAGAGTGSGMGSGMVSTGR